MARNFSTARASRADRRDGVVIGALVLLTGLGLLPFAHHAGPVIPAFMPAFAAAVSITELLTAYLLLTQLRLQAIEFAPLAAGYLFAGLSVVPQFLTFPTAAAPDGLLGAGSQTAAWLWVFWHGGFPLFLLTYVLFERSNGIRRRVEADPRRATRIASVWVVVGVPALVLALVALVVFGHDRLPVLIENGRYGGIMRSGLGWAIWALNIVAVIAIVSGWRRRMSHLDVWLAVAALAATMDVTLTLMADERFSLGWYAARIGAVVSSSVVLASFLHEIAWLYSALAAANARLTALAANDGLTGLANRRSFDEMLIRVIAHGQRLQTDLSLIMIDIDRFKALNDNYGHPVGDKCLAAVSQAVAGTLRRPFDFVARYGGEEFVALLSDTGEAGALDRAEAMLQAVRDLNLPNKGSEYGVVTISVGVATLSPRPWGSDREGLGRALLAAADKALYLSKTGGRNRASLGTHFLPDEIPANNFIPDQALAAP